MSLPPILDDEILQRIRSLESVRPGLLGKLVGMFIDNAATQRADIAQALAAADTERLRGLFHALKGSAANLGAAELAAVAAEGESQAKNGQPLESLALQVAQLESALDRALVALRAL